MTETFIVNIIHRPEMVPEYAEKVTGQGKAEDLGRKALLTESLDIFKTQQMLAHKYGLKTTIQMTYASLFNAEAVALAKEHHETYGDEIGLSLLGLPCEQFRQKYKTTPATIPGTPLWTAAPGRRGSRPRPTPTLRRPTRQKTAASSRSRT